MLLEAKSLISNLLTSILQLLIWNADVNWIKEKTFHLEKFSQKLLKYISFSFPFSRRMKLIVLWSPVEFETLSKKSRGEDSRTLWLIWKAFASWETSLRLSPYGLSFKMFSSVLPLCLWLKWAYPLNVAEFIALVKQTLLAFPTHNWIF